MAFQLNINFQGLIALVPTDGGSHIDVLLVEGRREMMTSDGTCVPAHFPVLIFDRADLKEGQAGSLPALEENARSGVLYVTPPSDDGSAQVRGFWFLDQQQLDVVADPAGAAPPQPLVVWNAQTQSTTNGNHPGKDASTFLTLIPAINDLDGSAAAVDPDCLLPAPNKGLVAARFHIKEGFLQSLGVQKDESGQEVVVEFRSSGLPAAAGNPRQRVSNGAQLQIQIPGDSATLYSTPFGGPRTPFLTFTPKGKSTLTVEVQNLPIQDILRLKKTFDEPVDVDTHFEMFYELSARRPPMHSRPVPHLVPKAVADSGPVRIVDVFCPPAVFQAPQG